MEKRLARLESAVVAIETSVTRLEDRIAKLEGGDPIESIPPQPPEEIGLDAGLVSEFQSPLAAIMGTPTLVGRSLLVLAGAFLLRALTEGGTFTPTAGVAIGVAYAAVWIAASAVAARKGARGSAGFYAVCSAMIVGPLLFEAATSFGVLSPAASATTLAVMTGAGLFVASRWRLQSAAWIFSLGGLATAAAMATVRPPGEAATAFLVGLGLAVFWLAEEREWDFLMWVTAFAADLGVLRLTAITTAPGARPENFGSVHPPFLAVLQAILVAGFVGTVVFRALRGRRPLKVFDFVQTAVVWIVGWGGAMQLARSQDWGASGLSLGAVVGALVAYYGAFGIVDRRQGRNRAFLYLSSLGLGLVLVGLPGLLGGASAAVWSIAAGAVAAVGSRWDRVTLRVHAAVLLMAAWIGSGFAAAVVARLGGAGDVPAIGAVLVGALTVVTTTIVLFGRRLRSPGWAQRLPLTIMLAMTALAVASAIALGFETAMGQGTALVVGTVALSMVTVGLAVLVAKAGVVEAGWLVYPFLVITGLRMIAVDLSSGRTLVLVIALATYGVALIVSTRLLRGMGTHFFRQA